MQYIEGQSLAEVIQDELNVKKITSCDNLDDLVHYNYKPNLKTLGPKFGKGLAAISKALPGIDDVLEGRPDVGRTLEKIPPAEMTILLAHEPDFADEASLTPVDLQLSGHSHGGQVWIPGIGAPWLPALARRYPRGLYKVRDLTLYTNIGLGTIRAPVRINCPPEITLITLRSKRS
jgi:predicted MPP superfamily phosphohydrolase